DQTYRDLVTNRRLLSELIKRKHARTRQRNHAFFYLHANKGGKLLAQMLRGAQVHALGTTRGTTTQFPEDIASEFQRFYAQLYNIRRDEDKLSRNTRELDTTDYLGGFRPDALTSGEAEELDTP
ncbi:Hypothetical predicted protein, partial [Pelobates cultripes]